MEDLSIVIPTLNEEENVGELISILKQEYRGSEIIIVDSGSQDKTKEIALKLKAKVIETGKGLCGAVLYGLRSAKRKFLIVMDADLQHPPSLIKEMHNGLKENDVVIGTRFKREDYGDFGFFRYVISRIATLIARMFVNVKDPMSGFFGIRKGLVEQINEERCVKGGYKVLFDILKQFKNIKIKEIGYKFQVRKKGESKLGYKQALSLIKSIIR